MPLLSFFSPELSLPFCTYRNPPHSSVVPSRGTNSSEFPSASGRRHFPLFRHFRFIFIQQISPGISPALGDSVHPSSSLFLPRFYSVSSQLSLLFRSSDRWESRVGLGRKYPDSGEESTLSVPDFPGFPRVRISGKNPEL